MWDEHESPTVTALTAERIWQKEHCMMPASSLLDLRGRANL